MDNYEERIKHYIYMHIYIHCTYIYTHIYIHTSVNAKNEETSLHNNKCMRIYVNLNKGILLFNIELNYESI